MHSRRPLTSLTLVFGAVLLLVAIAVGQRLGDRVLSGATEGRDDGGPLLVTPVPQASAQAGLAHNWKAQKVVSVATDPGFPDPLATPPPPPPPPPRPRRTQSPPTPQPSVAQREPSSKVPYTSPPLLIPLQVHTPPQAQAPPPDQNGVPQGIPPATPEPSPPA